MNTDGRPWCSAGSNMPRHVCPREWAYEHLSLTANMREDSRRVQRVINALGRRNAVEACGPADGLIALAMQHS